MANNLKTRLTTAAHDFREGMGTGAYRFAKEALLRYVFLKKELKKLKGEDYNLNSRIAQTIRTYGSLR